MQWRQVMIFTKEEKAKWLEDWKASGKKAWPYAKENGLIPQTFCSWTKGGTRKKKPGFVEIPKQLIRPIVQSQQIVIETGNLKIHIPLTICTEQLEMLFTVLGKMK